MQYKENLIELNQLSGTLFNQKPVIIMMDSPEAIMNEMTTAIEISTGANGRPRSH